MNAAEQAQGMAHYYDGLPAPPKEPATATQRAQYQHDKHLWEQKFAPGDAPPPPQPTPVPGPPSPGAGMPAARAGDMTNHGATIGPATTGLAANVIIGHKPAACLGDPHICPMVVGPKAHVGGTIVSGSSTVEIGYKPAARVADKTQCTAEPGAIASGEFTVEIGDLGGQGGAATQPAATPAAVDAAVDTAKTAPNESQGSPQSQRSNPPQETETPSRAPATGEESSGARKVGSSTHYIAVELVDESEAPVPGERYRITLPDRQKVEGRLDAAGTVRIEGFEKPGWCGIEFPDLDLAAWQRWTPGPGAKPAAGPGQVGADQPHGPIGAGGVSARRGKWHTVRQGDCTSSIAVDSGHFWRTLWQHEQNAELASLRGNPNALLPGDRVFVPERRPKSESAATNKEHKFKRLGEPARLHLTLLDDGDPRANEAYTLEIDGKTREGTTDAEGRIFETIPANARHAVLRIGQDEYRLGVGHVDPANEITGVQARLNNLGFGCGRVDGKWGKRTRRALNLFRQQVGLPASDGLDSATIRRLEELHDQMTAAASLRNDESADEPQWPADAQESAYAVGDVSMDKDPFYADTDE